MTQLQYHIICKYPVLISRETTCLNYKDQLANAVKENITVFS
jgi:hypothetical protein